MDEEHRIKQEKENAKNKFKRMKRASEDLKNMENEAAMELGESLTNLEPLKTQNELKFFPHPPPPKDKFPSPLGKHHVRTPKLAPLKQKGIFKFLFLYEPF